MTSFQMAPGATVISTPTHGGLTRMTAGTALLAKLLMSAIHSLERWNTARIEAHNAAMLCELAPHDPRVLAEVRAAQSRIQG